MGDGNGFVQQTVNVVNITPMWQMTRRNKSQQVQNLEEAEIKSGAKTGG